MKTRQVTLHMFEPGGYESPEFCRHCGEREDHRTHVAPLRYHNAGSLLHELATAASIMLDSPEYQSANEALSEFVDFRRLTRSVQNARSFLAGEDMPILAIEAQARPAVASEGLTYARLHHALAVVLEDYYHERGHDYEHDAGQLAMLLLAQGIASDAGSVGALDARLLSHAIHTWAARRGIGYTWGKPEWLNAAGEVRAEYERLAAAYDAEGERE